MTALAAAGLHVGYGEQRVLEGLDLEVPDGELTAIIGPNACGKSTLLRALARLVKPSAGEVRIDGRDIRAMSQRALARRLSILPQSPLAPDGITVLDLVRRGRFPHRRLLAPWSRADERAVDEALAAVSATALADRRVAELSGGQRQRVWIAMVLAQASPIVLLDEPTTFLDVAHQLEVLELIRSLRDEGRTIVAVLHDMNQAARFATHVVAMRDGAIVGQGDPRRVVDAALVSRVFGVEAQVIADPLDGVPVVLPRSVGVASSSSDEASPR